MSAQRAHLQAPAKRQALPRITSVEALLQRISAEFEHLSKQHKVIARYLEQHCDHIGMEKIQSVAERCCVTPSAIVRFAKHFGFHGYMELKAVFRGSLDQEIATSRVYHDRIHDALGDMPVCLSSADVAHEFIRGALAGMRELQRDIHDSTLSEAVELMASAQALWVAGARSAFPVAAYLAYGLQHTRKSIQLITHIGAMQAGQLRGLRADDVMIAVSFAPHAEETLTAAQIAASNGTKLIVITDSPMNALAREADVVLLVRESCTFGFRASTNSMALAQGIFIALAYRIEIKNGSLTGAAACSHHNIRSF
ncbi:MAG: MurR/RpiR family transcriptional regulator [Burkholderiales bacterium]